MRSISVARTLSCVPRLPGAAAAALVATLLVVASWLAPSTTAQPPVPATSTPLPTAGPPPDVSGEWSITRTWYRSCPRCGFPVIRTTPWQIVQSGQDVHVDRGPRGTIVGAPGGGGYLSLAGTETDGFDVQRFWYGTLHVAPGGSSFEGQFGGSETIQNPCGDIPPIVTCLVSAGWIRGQRVSPVAPVATPPGPPTPPAFPTPAGPTPTATSTLAPGTDTPTPAPTPTATPTVRPLSFPRLGADL